MTGRVTIEDVPCQFCQGSGDLPRGRYCLGCNGRGYWHCQECLAGCSCGAQEEALARVRGLALRLTSSNREQLLWLTARSSGCLPTGSQLVSEGLARIAVPGHSMVPGAFVPDECRATSLGHAVAIVVQEQQP